MAEIAGEDPKAAFLRIFEEYAPAIERLAGAYAAAREDREDLVQEIAAALWRALPGYRAEASQRTWLYRIAHNVAITATFKQRQREKREVVPDRHRTSVGGRQRRTASAGGGKKAHPIRGDPRSGADGPANHRAAPGRVERRRN